MGDDSAPSSSRRRSGRLRTIHARQAELKAREIRFRCAAPPHAEVRVVSLGAAKENPTAENGGVRPSDGAPIPFGYEVVGTLFNEPLRAWVDAAGAHHVRWGAPGDGREEAASAAEGAADAPSAVARAADEIARRLREDVPPVLPARLAGPPSRRRQESRGRGRGRQARRPRAGARVQQLRVHVARHAAHAPRPRRRPVALQRVRPLVRAERHHAPRGGRARAPGA